MAVDFNIQSIQPSTLIQGIGGLGGAAKSSATDGSMFREMFADAMAKVDGQRAEAHQQVQKFLAGEEDDPHKMVLAVQEADLSFQMFLQVRNKFTQAYQEVMRMQL